MTWLSFIHPHIDVLADRVKTLCRQILAGLSTAICLLVPSLVLAEPHYVTQNGLPLADYENGYAILQSYFGDSVPKRITIEPTNKSRSLFQPNDNRVLISSKSQYKEYNACTVEHESSHLALYAFTKGASLREEFRFIDEGFATIIEAEACHRSEGYKRRALRVAVDSMRKNRVSFAAVQQWTNYFGVPDRGNLNLDSYQVGASFDYFLWDTYGKDRLLAFFRALGESGELGAALQKAIGKDKASVEAEWLSYLSQPMPEGSAPEIARLYPDNQASGVPLETTEIVVEFDQPMLPSISLLTNCDDGVCYRDAYWRSDRVLVIKVKLLPDHEYRLGFGNEKTKVQKFLNIEGTALPISAWTFRTTSQ